MGGREGMIQCEGVLMCRCVKWGAVGGVSSD